MEEEDYDPALHHRVHGSSNLTVIVGEDPSKGQGKNSRSTSFSLFRGGGTSSHNNNNNNNNNNNSSTTNSLDPYHPSVLGTPFIAWNRDTARFLARDTSLCVDIHAWLGSSPQTEALGGQMVVGGGIKTTAASLDTRPQSTPPFLKTVTTAAPKELPNAFISVRLQRLALNVSSEDIVVGSRIVTAVTSPILAWQSRHSSSAHSVAHAGRNLINDPSFTEELNSRKSALQDAAKRAAGVFPSLVVPVLEPPFDAAPPAFYEFADIKLVRGHLLAEVLRLKASKDSGKVKGHFSKKVQDEERSSKGTNSSKSPLEDPSCPAGPFLSLLDVTVSSLSLRLEVAQSSSLGVVPATSSATTVPRVPSSTSLSSFSSSSSSSSLSRLLSTSASSSSLLQQQRGGSGGRLIGGFYPSVVDADPPYPICDIILASEGFSLTLAGRLAGFSYASEVASLALYSSAKTVPRAMLIQTSLRVFGGSLPKQVAAEGEEDLSSSPPNYASKSAAATAAPGLDILNSLNVELRGAEVCLVRRPRISLKDWSTTPPAKQQQRQQVGGGGGGGGGGSLDANGSFNYTRWNAWRGRKGGYNRSFLRLTNCRS